jgi:hypothetical protein
MCRRYASKRQPYVRVCWTAPIVTIRGQHLSVPRDWEQIGCLNDRELAHLKRIGYGRCIGHGRRKSPAHAQPVTRRRIGGPHSDELPTQKEQAQKEPSHD